MVLFFILLFYFIGIAKHYYSLNYFKKYTADIESCNANTLVDSVTISKKIFNKDGTAYSCILTPKVSIDALCGFYGDEFETESSDMFNTWSVFTYGLKQNNKITDSTLRKIANIKPDLLGSSYNLFIFYGNKFNWIKISPKDSYAYNLLQIAIGKNDSPSDDYRQGTNVNQCFSSVDKNLQKIVIGFGSKN